MTVWPKVLPLVSTFGAIATAICLSGCRTGSQDLTQEVRITFLRNNAPAVGIQFKLVPESPINDCSREGQAGVTSADGTWKSSRKKSSSNVSYFAVIVQHDTICIQEQGKWKPIWSSAYGPFMDQLDIRCELSNPPNVNPQGVISNVCDISVNRAGGKP